MACLEDSHETCVSLYQIIGIGDCQIMTEILCHQCFSLWHNCLITGVGNNMHYSGTEEDEPVRTLGQLGHVSMFAGLNGFVLAGGDSCEGW